MNVQRKAGLFDDRLWQQQTICGDDKDFRCERSKRFDLVVRFQTGGLKNRNRQINGRLFHGAGHDKAASAGRPIGLGIDGDDLDPRIRAQSLQ